MGHKVLELQRYGPLCGYPIELSRQDIKYVLNNKKQAMVFFNMKRTPEQSVLSPD